MPSSRPRLHELDFVRGAALLGILVVNLPFHGLPVETAMSVPQADARSELLAWSAVTALFEYKFVSLFSLLFGMSLVLQRDALLASTGRWIAPMLRRQGFLIAAGLLHGTLLFVGDILLPYGILGMLALLALRWRPRTVTFVACGLLVLATFVEG